MPEFHKEYLNLALKGLLDPIEQFYSTKEEMKAMAKELKTVAINVDPEEVNLGAKGLVFDKVCESFAQGSTGRISNWSSEKNTKSPLIIRGLGKSSQEAIKHCMDTSRDFYAIDTGYLQVAGSKAKNYHRVTKNNLQYLGPIIERPEDRLTKLRWELTPAPNGEKILICPPSDKVMNFYNRDLNQWIRDTVRRIERHTIREIEIREKPTRRERVTNNTIWQVLDDAYCLITFNSIAATEAILYGVPAIALAPNAASTVCSTRISDIEKLETPADKTRVNFAKHLSYCQFTLEELQSGYAWNIVNEGV